MKMQCWKCKRKMLREQSLFHGFKVKGWNCPGCKETIFDEKEIQPILHYNKLKETKKELTATVGVLGKSKILRIPKIAEQIYKISKGEKLKLFLEPDSISVKIRGKV